jgi:hypothetical protein
LVLLLEEIQKEYSSIVTYYKDPLLAKKCIQLDIDIARAFLEKDPENIYSVSYFDNLNKFQICYECLSKYKDEFLNPIVNYKTESDNYFLNPATFSIQKVQYELYISYIMLYYSFNQFDIWKLYYESSASFVKIITVDSAQQINAAKNINEEYDHQYNKEDQQFFMNQYKIYGLTSQIIEDPVTKDKSMEWYLVKNDGNKAIDSKASLLTKEFNNSTL